MILGAFFGGRPLTRNPNHILRAGILYAAATLAALAIAATSTAIATATQQPSETPKATIGHPAPEAGVNPTQTPTKTPTPPPQQDGPDRDSYYTWHDGNRTIKVQVMPSATPPGDKDPYADRSPDDSAGITFRTVSGGATMTLPGGVLVKLNPYWTRQETDAFFKANGIRPNRVRQLQLLDNTFFVGTEPGLPSLQLANALATQEGVMSSIPNWGSEVDLHQTPNDDDNDDDHGDDIDSATELPLDTLTPGIINHDDDVDYFRFELSEETLVAVGNIPEGEPYGLTGNDFALFNQDGTNLTSLWVAKKRLQPGTYYVAVDYDHTDRRRREYNIIAKTIPDHGDTIDTATAMNLTGTYDGVPSIHNIAMIADLHSDEDIDFFKVTLERDTEVIIYFGTDHGVVPEVGLPFTPINVDLLSASGSYADSPVSGVSMFGRPYHLETGTHYFRVAAYTELSRSYAGQYDIFFAENTPYVEFIKSCTDITDTYDDPLYSCQWHLENDEDNPGTEDEDIKIGGTWGTTKGAGINVAVIDKAIESSHEDLAGNWNDDLDWNYLGPNDQADPRGYHGTAVAGIIAAADNSVGGLGVAPEAAIVGRNILEDHSINNAIDAFTRDAGHIAIANNSWGYSGYISHYTVPQLWLDALEEGINKGFDGKGTLYVFSAGNGHQDGQHPNQSEASNFYAQVLVCAVDADGEREFYSVVGHVLWVCAPSAKVTTSNRNRYRGNFGGTSASAPVVSGVAALLRSAYPDLTWRDLKLILAGSARKNDASDSGWEDGALEYGSNSERYSYNPEYGFGVVDASAAMKLARDWTTLPQFLNSSAETEETTLSIPEMENGLSPTAIASGLSIGSHIAFIEFVEVHVDLDHPGFRELKITLESPSGTTSVLMPGEGWGEGYFSGDESVSVPFRMGSARHLGEDPNGTWTLSVSDHKEGGQGTLKGWSIKFYGHGDSEGRPLITGTAQVHETLTVDTSGFDDADGSTGAVFTYQWLAVNAEIPGATNDSYTLVNADMGKTIRVKVSFTDDRNFRPIRTSTPTAVVAAPAGTVWWATLDAGSSYGGTWGYNSFLNYGTLSPTAFSLDGNDYVVKALVAQGNGDVKLYLNQKTPRDFTLDVQGSRLSSQDARKREITNPAVRSYYYTWVNTNVRFAGAPTVVVMSMGLPTITGTARVGETLTVETSAIDDAEGLANAMFSYQWLADNQDIPGATGDSYTLVAADVGKTIRVRVSFTDDADNEETLTSATTAAVVLAPPGAPQRLVVSAHDSGALDLQWEAPVSDGGSPIVWYRVQWEETGGVQGVSPWSPDMNQILVGRPTPHIITGLTDGVEYVVRVIATNSMGDGPPSAEVRGTPGKTTPPELVTATVDGATMTLTYDKDLDENSEPSSDAFSVTVAGTDGSINRVSVSGRSVTLTLASAVTSEDAVTVSYTVPTDVSVPRIQDLAGNAAESFSDQDVENNTPPAANTPATGAPTISGTAHVGETLTADISGIGDDDGLPAGSEFDYQWIRNDGSTDANIADATYSTYVLLAADVGKFIKVRVTFTDKNDHTETLTSAAATAVTVPTRTTVTLSLHTTTLSEDASATTVTVTGTPGEVLTTDTDVTVSVTGGTADSGVDFTAVNDFTLTIPANSPSRTATFELTPRNDSLVEGDETLTVSGTATYHDVEPASLTLTDGDSATLSFGVDATTVAEADAGEATLMVSITNGVTFQRGGNVKVTLEGTAAAGWDYTFTDSVGRTFTKPYVVVMPAGASSVTATIAAVDDEGDDDAETVTVALTYDGVAVGSTQTITITDDDNAPALALSGLTIETTNPRAAYPAFDADTVHYAVGCEPADTLTVTPTATGSNVRISVSGTQTTSGASVTSTGLDGDSDITVVLANATGESRTYTIHCLPDDFPSVTVVKEAGAWDSLLVGSIGMGPLNRAPDRWSFLVIMDTNGVPRYHRKISGRIASHFRPQDGGAYPYGFFRNNPGELMLLDGNLDDAHLITRASWQSLTDHPGWEDAYPDIHDFVNKPDGTSVFVIDDPLTRDLSDIGFGSFGTEEMEDEIIIEVTPQGGFVKEVWNSWKNVELWDCTQSHFLGNAYSHFNSIELLTDGDYLISLRGCSKILKVDSETGDVLWRVGRSNLSDDEWTEKGRTPPYTIVDDPHDEFCGQHSAKIIGNGNLLLYDDGVYCVQHPETQETNRANNVFSRVVEYALDHERGEARFLRHHSFESKFDAVTSATGLVAPMDNGNWWISWGRSTDADVTQSITEVDPSTNTELLHMLFEDDAGERRRTRSYPLRPDEFAPDLPPLTARIVEAPSSFDPGAAEGARVVVAFNRPVVDFPANTPSVSVTGATATVATLVEAGKPANAYVFTLTGEGGAIEFSLLADQTCASGGICAEDGTLLSVVPVTHTIPGPATQNTPSTGAPTITGTAQVGETLTADISGIDDEDGLDNVSFGYQWLADDTEIAGATDPTYTLVDDDASLTIKVQVSFFDDKSNPETLTSAATAAVEAASPAPGPITGFTVVDASDQSVEGALADGGALALDDPDGGSFGIRADLESGATIGSMSLQLTGEKTHDQTENIAPYSLYGDSGGNLSGELLPVGEYTLTATAYSEARLGGNVLGTLKVSFSVTETATQQPNTPATGLPTISGTAQVGETLTVGTSGIDDADGIGNATFSYQWIAGTTDISGATGSSYAPSVADLGKTIKVRVSFMDGASNVETLTSEATATVIAAVTPLTAGFQDAPDEHDGTGVFTFEIAFSEPISISYKTLRDDSLEVTNGSATKAKRVDGQSDLWKITVEPDSDADVTVVLPVTEDCAAQDAVCTRDGTKLSNRSELTVPGPAAANSPATGAPSISGTAQVGETLTVDTSGIDDADGMSGAVFSYQWLADGVDIAGATSDTYTLVEADVGKAVKVRVIFNDDDYNEETLTSEATAAVAAETAAPDAPQSLNVSPDDTGTLGVSWEAPASDGGSAITGYKVQWKSGSEDYDGSAGSTRQAEITDPASRTHTITGLTDGVEYAVRVIATNDVGDGPPSDEAMATPRETTPPELSAATVDGAALTLTYDEDLDENSEPSSDAFSVTAGGTGRVVDGVSVAGDTVTLTLASKVTAADTVTVSYTAPTDTAAPRIRDLAGNAAASFSDELVTNNTPPPANTPATGAPIISGTARVGETLTADTSAIDDADGLDNVGYSYQWLANGADITGATSSSYTLVDADKGKTIQVKVSFRDDRNNPETLTSAATAAVEPRPNSPATGAPTISGTVRVGETLTAETSAIADADGMSGAVFIYQWLANGADVAGATSDTYALVPDDVGKAIKVKVSFRDDRNHQESLTSAATAAVEPRPNSPATGAPTISGTAQVGETLTAETSGIDDADGLDNVSYSYQWLANGADIAGATSDTYTPVADDVGKAIKVRVTFRDDRNHQESLTSAATTAVTAAADESAVWSATLTVGSIGGFRGFWKDVGMGELTPEVFTLDGVDHTVKVLADSDGPQFYLTVDKALPVGFTLQVGTATLSSQGASIREFSSGATQYGWATNQEAVLADVDTVEVSLTLAE